MDIFSFGASTAEGKKDDEGGGFIGRLGRKFERRADVRCVNRGIGGNTTADMVLRLSREPAPQPEDIALIALGVNDVPRTGDRNAQKRLPLELHAENVRTILGFFQTHCRVLYMSQYPVDPVRTGTVAQAVSDYVRAGMSVARDLGVNVLDIHAEIDEKRFRRFIHDDGLHFNGHGHAFMADRILERLVELGWLM